MLVDLIAFDEVLSLSDQTTRIRYRNDYRGSNLSWRAY